VALSWQFRLGDTDFEVRSGLELMVRVWVMMAFLVYVCVQRQGFQSGAQ
jgi:hypothetical protein